jgi:hypothetical protein
MPHNERRRPSQTAGAASNNNTFMVSAPPPSGAAVAGECVLPDPVIVSAPDGSPVWLCRTCGRPAVGRWAR